LAATPGLQLRYGEKRKCGTEVILLCAGTTEKALDAYVEGDEKTGGKLVGQAKNVNEAAVRDVHEE
jgi:hypothetical protein